MLRLRYLSICCILTLCQQVTCQFSTPPDSSSGSSVNNIQYVVGQLLHLQWTTSLNETDLLMWQQNGSVDPYRILIGTSEQSFDWVVSYENFNSTNSTAFILQVFETGSTSPSLTSVQFNITESKSTSTTAASLPPTATTTITVSPVPTASASTSGLSGGAVAGIAIGSALGALAIAGLVLFGLRRRSREGQTLTEVKEDTPAPVAVNQQPWQAETAELPQYPDGRGNPTHELQ
ncbi:hypothetical protein BGW36DRAFT_353744 [Talaromyces proteolyticus]|uniref:Mid2 domain-containing protein n=1 Tax=Talaromyces proteolyticus TaxID=1131652 RepID=A0AAD4L2B8_9EURO|nr:uncharacterized protein BGW36DRAFT_353744 [Talaromyces proteolyticus]KAH8705336.1 hypothetical protein BGW36DRAFT_353744 [Talaromyces proteolyticus]